MWGRKPNSEPDSSAPSQPQAQPEPARRAPAASAPAAPPKPASRQGTFATPSACVGKRLQFKGEISGTEDLQVDGDFSGKIELKENCLTIGPNARVEADVYARAICIHGRLKGNVEAPERIELHKTGSLEGDVVTAGIVIEEGAVFRGSIDIVRPEAKDAATLARKSTPSKPAESSSGSPGNPRKAPEPASAAVG